ncbi:hypothetical protein [Listeria goaensis]|uniref:hypothetical protein n=1 Tax=Listeria goaensis TaxID=1649188 RepID=UPI000B5976A0|nr:hypothetical protein [Listeria goaensis]
MTKKKWIIGIGICALLISGGVGLTQYQTHAKAEEKQQAVQKAEAQLAQQVEAYKKEGASFYLNDKKELLAKDVTVKDVQALKSKLQKLEGKEMTVTTAEKLNTATVDTADAEKMIALRDQVKKLLDPKGVLTENANVADVKKQANELKDVKPVFYAEQNKWIQQAKQQHDQLEKAQNAVDALFTDATRKTIKESITRSQFQTALSEKNKVKQSKAKQALIADLNRVENYLVTNEKQNEQANQSNQAKQKATETQESQASSSQNSTSSSKSYKQGSSSTSESSRSGSKSNSSSPTQKSTSGNTSGSSGHSSNSASNGSSSSQSSDELTPGDSWDVEWSDGGYIDGEDGNTWEGGSW